MGVVTGRCRLLRRRAPFFSTETTFMPEDVMTVVPNNDICVIEFPNVVTYLYFDVFFPLFA
jgi:hypothetical protein